jgi:excisionase family DNA binding protein
MRTSTYDIIIADDGNRLLSTGEAAKILNSSRQHVIDLCDRGELPFVTIGTHRRV